MKKYLTTSTVYAGLALISGLFYREFTKLMGFTGQTTLSLVHTHLFSMGMLFFLVLMALENTVKLSAARQEKLFFVLYNLGMAVTVGGLIWRGVVQTLSVDISSSLSAAIAGVSGLGHIILTAGLAYFFINLWKQVKLTAGK